MGSARSRISLFIAYSKATEMNYKTYIAMNNVLIAVLNLIGVIVSSIGVVYVKEKLSRKRSKIITKTYAHKAECWLMLDKIASDIREKLNARGVFIAYFHNGDKFCNGIHMDKFTVIADDYDVSIERSYKEAYKNVLTSIMPYAILRLYRSGSYVFRMSEVTKYHSTAYVTDLKSRGCNSAISVLIKDLKTDVPIGFLSVECEKDFKPDHEFMNNLWKHHNCISRNMNMIIDKPEKEQL
ncbi:MAG: hypothetical protein HDQ88_04660 [Clostridia bacterium]|nr:hypothetical protein [Clostridia bacterium]